MLFRRIVLTVKHVFEEVPVLVGIPRLDSMMGIVALPNHGLY